MYMFLSLSPSLSLYICIYIYLFTSFSEDLLPASRVTGAQFRISRR